MIQILQLQKANLSELARFIVCENISRHNALYNDETIVREINRVFTEDLSLFDSSVFYVGKNRMNTIVGSVKITTWNNKDILPIEKLFSINLPSLLCNDKKTICHIGRLAISQTTSANGYMLFKKLITLAIYSICRENNSIMIAECDKKLLKTLTLLGIKTKILAKPVSYLGSDTFPIYATTDWLKVFLTNNEHLQEIEKIFTDCSHVNPKIFTKALSVNPNKLEGSCS